MWVALGFMTIHRVCARECVCQQEVIKRKWKKWAHYEKEKLMDTKWILNKFKSLLGELIKKNKQNYGIARRKTKETKINETMQSWK